MSQTAPMSKPDFIASLAGRYNQLQDSNTISSTKRFNSYLYTRKLVIRKLIPNDPGLSLLINTSIKLICIDHELIYCTHCKREPWKVPTNFTTTSGLLRHRRRYHTNLPSTYELEKEKLRELELANTNVTTVITPFTLAAAGADI